MIIIFASFIILGCFTGFLAGLFGIGGGVLLVPSLLIFFKYFQFSSEHLMHMVLGTSLSCILITCINSSLTHMKKTALDKYVYFNLTIGIVIGAASGGFVSTRLTSYQLQVFFSLFLFAVTLKMFLGANDVSKVKKLPKIFYWFIGSLIGLKSSLLGVGGGTLSVPFLNWTGKKMHEAVSISSALGVPIAFIGSITYIISGYGNINMPEYSLGHIYLPAFIGISLSSTFSARYGATISHKLSHERLRNIFKYFLILLFLKSLYNLYY